MKKGITPNQREAEILAILINGEKYGQAIRDEYQKRTRKTLPLGSLYVTLDRMEDKGFVKSRLEDNPGEARVGNRRKYFKVTASGSRSLSVFEGWILGFQRSFGR